MQNIYRETFEQIHASEQLRKEVANVPKQEKAAFRHRISKAGLIAAALALALAGTVLAVASPTLWWWFEQKWEEETGSSMTESQSLVIDGLTRKVGESVTSGDVTVTVDSITVGSSQIWALLDVTGWDFDRDAQYSFDRMRAEIVPDPSGGQHGGAGYGLDSIGITREGAARMLLEFSATISTGNQLNRGDYALEIDLNDLIRRRTGGAEDEVLCEGEWSFSIPLAAESLSPTITIDRVQVLSNHMVWDQATGKDGGALEGTGGKSHPAVATLTNLQITATGASFYCDGLMDRLHATVILADGTEVENRGGGGSRMEDGGWYVSFDWPVPLDPLWRCRNSVELSETCKERPAKSRRGVFVTFTFLSSPSAARRQTPAGPAASSGGRSACRKWGRPAGHHPGRTGRTAE